MARLLRVILCFLVLFPPMFSLAQTDYEIVGARKVKMGYEAFPRDVRSEELTWKGLQTDCLSSLEFGNWFDLKLKGDRMQFTVHTGGRFGDASDPGLYLGKVVTDKGTRSIEQVSCIQHQGNDGTFKLQATGLDEAGSYFVLVTVPADGLSYAISTTTSFEVQALEEEPTEQRITEAFAKIFGRITNKKGEGVAQIPVTLLNEAQEALATTTSDENGAFQFKELPKDEVYLTRIESEDTELVVDMFLVDEAGAIVNRSSRIDGKLFGFGAREDAFPQLNLLTERYWKVESVERGKVAVLGKVVDRSTYLRGQPGVEVGLYDQDRKLLQTMNTDAQGNFRFNNLARDNYDVRLQQEDDQYAEVVLIDDLLVPYQFANSSMMGADGFFVFERLPEDIVRLQRMEAKDTSPSLMPDFSHMEDGQPIVLRNILFASGSSELLPSSHRDLDVLAEELNARPAIRVMISGHTDNSGHEEMNRMLSEARAKAVVQYLKGQGVGPDRMEYKGLGSQQPVASNQTEEGRKRNRRVEFVVLD
jgi:outer membrane protein OmpA-like peptidoglycan-associated protein